MQSVVSFVPVCRHRLKEDVCLFMMFFDVIDENDD